MNWRRWFTKLNNSARPMHVAGQSTAVEKLYDTKNDDLIVESIPFTQSTATLNDERQNQ